MATTQTAPKKKGLINFDFLQKLGKVLMTVIAVMPAAGLMISLGKLVQMSGGDIAAVMTIGTTMENIGWAVINNLHILFAVAIGGSWAKERAGGAFAAVLAFALINVITGNIFGVTSAMLTDPNAVTHTLFGQEIAVNGYFTSVLGAPALNMGVFVGIIAGFVGGVAYNKYYNFRKLPDALAFFNGKRFVPMVVIAYSVVISMVLALFWPVVQTGIPMSLQAGLGGDIINFVLCVVAFFLIGYFVAYFMIGKLNLATPGRLGNYTDDNANDAAADTKTEKKADKKADNGQAERIIALLGGRENIVLVDACMTRLRVTVKDPAKVADLAAWKAEGALSLLVKGDGIQAVYGPKADVLKSDINDIL